MTIVDNYGTDDLTVFVKDTNVYVSVDGAITAINTIMHFAEPCKDGMDVIFDPDSVTELYKGAGIIKFKV